MGLEWNETIYKKCRTICRHQVQVTRLSPFVVVHELQTPQHLPECLFINTVRYPYSHITTSILKGKYILKRRNCYEFEDWVNKPQLVSHPDIIPKYLSYFSLFDRQGGPCNYKIVYGKWNNIYYIFTIHTDEWTNNNLVFCFCAFYCYLFQIRTFLICNDKINLVTDVVDIILSFLDLTDSIALKLEA